MLRHGSPSGGFAGRRPARPQAPLACSQIGKLSGACSSARALSRHVSQSALAPPAAGRGRIVPIERGRSRAHTHLTPELPQNGLSSNIILSPARIGPPFLPPAGRKPGKPFRSGGSVRIRRHSARGSVRETARRSGPAEGRGDRGRPGRNDLRPGPRRPDVPRRRRTGTTRAGDPRGASVVRGPRRTTGSTGKKTAGVRTGPFGRRSKGRLPAIRTQTGGDASAWAAAAAAFLRARAAALIWSRGAASTISAALSASVHPSGNGGKFRSAVAGASSAASAADGGGGGGGGGAAVATAGFRAGAAWPWD